LPNPTRSHAGTGPVRKSSAGQSIRKSWPDYLGDLRSVERLFPPFSACGFFQSLKFPPSQRSPSKERLPEERGNPSLLTSGGNTYHSPETSCTYSSTSSTRASDLRYGSCHRRHCARLVALGAQNVAVLGAKRRSRNPDFAFELKLLRNPISNIGCPSPQIQGCHVSYGSAFYK